MIRLIVGLVGAALAWFGATQARRHREGVAGAIFHRPSGPVFLLLIMLVGLSLIVWAVFFAR